MKVPAHPILASIMALTGGGCGMDEAGVKDKQEMQAQRIAILTVATNIHAIRWINALAERGLDLIVITQQPPLPGDYHPSVRFVLLPFRGRLAYLLNALVLPRIFARTGAPLLHVHYAGGYGATVWLSGIRNSLISVWGGDVYDVPGRSALHRRAVCGALEKAALITSTSHVMKAQVERLGVSTPIDVVPFGVDTDRFRPGLHPKTQGRLVIGTVKTLARKYGIDTLIRGFDLALRDSHFRALDPELHLVGGGPAQQEYEQLAVSLDLGDRIRFHGQVRHDQVPAILSGFDIYAAISRDDSESFGVAIIEASACGLPVLVSDAGGLPEVVEDEVTGMIIPRDDPAAVSRALLRLAADPALRKKMGAAGRQRVMRLYEWSACVDAMIAIYTQIIGSGVMTGRQNGFARLVQRATKPRGPLCVPTRFAKGL
ncbi:glycosyltransferase [Sphingobium sp. MI1205]|uniref:glycosyltransferase n=1 Tax=Sphingobium sp. MI1205 TaxID=407020 RepID=UPI001F16F650|nr:glycosyltransferase [Sphingobium sp. MI1205]